MLCCGCSACKSNVESAVFCEACVNLESQLRSVQEELNSTKLVSRFS
jgi:hypothetical protein